MRKVFNADILDIFPIDTGFIYACKEILDDGNEVAGFFKYSRAEDRFERISVRSYIIFKYSEDGFGLAKNLIDFITPSVRSISSVQNIAAYNDGTIKLFDPYGIITETRTVKYQGAIACSPEPVGRDLWMVVPDANAVVNYSIKYDRIEFRIGSKEEKTFSHPVSLSYYDDCLYICNASSYKIKTVSLDDYKVADKHIFNEPVYKYFRVKNEEYVHLKSGVHRL